MWWKVLILAVIDAILYRLGGMGDEGRKKYPNVPSWLFDTKTRDIGCALTTGFGMWWCFGIETWWAHLLAFLCLFGALTTYWDELFGFDNFWFHGFMCALAYFWYALAGDISWVACGIRCVALALFMGIWCHVLMTDDDLEELGRGSSLAFTLPIYLIALG